MKRLQGLMAATVITLIVAFGMVVIGADAASNTNTAPINAAPASAPAASPANQVQSASQAQLDQLQSLIKQYQDREKQYQSREQQYQTELKSVSQKLNDATSQVDQLQQVLMALQQRGVISISRDGRIFVNGD